MEGIGTSAVNLQLAANIEMLKKALALQAQPLQEITQALQALQPSQIEPTDQKAMGLGNNIDVYG